MEQSMPSHFEGDREKKPELSEKIRIIENELIPNFNDACRKLHQLAGRIGLTLPKEDMLESAVDPPRPLGYVFQLSGIIGELRRQSETLNGVLSELERLV